MSKTISRENLPAFRYFPEITPEEFAEIYNLYMSSHEWFISMGITAVPYARAVAIYSRFSNLFAFYETFEQNHPECSGWFQNKLLTRKHFSLKNLRNTGNCISLEDWNKLRAYVSAARGIAEELMYLFEHQGLYIEGEFRFGFSCVPKLLLLSISRYQKSVQSDLIDITIADICNLLSDGIRYEIIVQSDNDVGKYAFSVYSLGKKKDFFKLTMLVTDYENKQTFSYAFLGFNDTETKAFGFLANRECIQKKCPYVLQGKKKAFCQANMGECPDGNYRDAAFAVLAALKDYLIVKSSYQTPHTDISSPSETEPMPKYYDKDGIAVYEYYTGKDYISTLKYTGEGKSGYEVRAHVRRGFMRYNPKTGDKDIAVKACIIHKDQYNGFETADRLNT